ncbi:polysaccharide synthase [Poronia punctata]|nr:polysaccharide synthase [Poronia punctata]
MEMERTIVAPAVLAGFCLWGKLDAWYISKTPYEPVPIPTNPKYTSKDVSLVVCTIGPVENFAECLQSWLANDPLEIIFITIDSYLDEIKTVLEKTQDTLNISDEQRISMKLLSVEGVGRRRQSVKGYNAARGSIIASVDDHILWPKDFLPLMLAGFEEPGVGGVAPICGLYMSPERQDDKVVTPWEAVGARALWKGKSRYKAVYATCGWSWVLAGMTSFYRAAILQDANFQKEFLNDYWFGKGPLDAHDDGCITRWALRKDWKMCVQNAGPDTEVRRTVKRTDAFLAQYFRWERGSIQSHWIYAFTVPQVWRNPYVAFKTLERMARPLTTTVHIIAWLVSWIYYPRATALLAFYYVFSSAPSHAAFLGEHPYMWRHLWALFLVDYFYVIQDYYCWATINDIRWGGRKIKGE